MSNSNDNKSNKLSGWLSGLILFIPGATIGFILGNSISNLLKMVGVNGVSAEAVAFVMGVFTAFLGQYLYSRARYEATKVGGITSVFIKVLIIAIVICAGIIFLNEAGALKLIK